MKPEFDLIIVTADEPYGGLSHTQILFANYLSQLTDVIFIEAPGAWHPLKIFHRKKISGPAKGKPSVHSYFNFLPAILPFAAVVNEYILSQFISKLLQDWNKKKVLVWHFDSYRSELKSKALKRRGEITHLYHVIDPYYDNPKDAALRKSSHLILVTSPHVAEHYEAQSHKLRLLPQCVDLKECDRFLSLTPALPVPETPFLMLLGTVSDDLDFELLTQIADEAPVLIAGKIVRMPKKEQACQNLLKHKNVQYLGLLKPETFYPLLRQASAGLICYDTKIRNLPFSPLKAINYLIAGLPVISNCRTELEMLHEIAVYEKPERKEFLKTCRQALNGMLPPDADRLHQYLESISIEKAVAQVFSELNKPH